MTQEIEKKLIWHTEKRLIKDLIPTEGNPRQMTEKEAEDLKQSLKRFNLVDIPAINLDNRIISGHQRISILKTEGRESEEIDVRVPNRKLTEAEHKEYLLRANKNLGSWNYDLLANFSEEELNNVGFESEELDKIFQLEASEDDFDAEAEAEKIKEPKVKLGDLFQLGNHRLLCGDSTKKEDVEKLMGGEKADMVFTDPPYGVTKEKWDRELQWEDVKMGLDFSDGVVCYFNASQTEKIKRILNFPIIADRILVWRKQSSFGGKGMSRNWQPIFVWRAEKIKSGWDAIEFEFAIPDKTGEHSTQKPIALCEKIIKNSSERNNIVLDLFGGSGSTLIACEQLNRRCFMCEISPIYVEVIINRWEKFTGRTAKKLN